MAVGGLLTNGLSFGTVNTIITDGFNDIAASVLPDVGSIVPNAGDNNTVVAVDIYGLRLTGGTVQINSTGVTASSVVVVDATHITANFTIANGAAVGSRDVTVTTSNGVSNIVQFYVNASGVSGGEYDVIFRRRRGRKK